MNELALFAGAGGGILGGKLLGWRTVCAVEWEPYPASVLCARQNDGLLPPFPIWDDVQTFNGFAWRGLIDVVSGGFPCQDISAAGKGAGIDGERSGMWSHMARVVGEVRPRYVFVENSPMLVTRGLERVLGDLTALGYDTKWTVMGAADVGANHQRDRIWIVATKMAYSGSQRWKPNKHIGNTEGREIYRSVSQQGKNGGEQSLDNTLFTGLEREDYQQESPRGIQQEPSKRCNQVSNATSIGLPGQGQYEQSINPEESRERQATELVYGRSSDFWAIEPNVGRVADGVAARVDRLKAIGNGQVPLCAATAWRLLTA